MYSLFLILHLPPSSCLFLPSSLNYVVELNEIADTQTMFDLQGQLHLVQANIRINFCFLL